MFDLFIFLHPHILRFLCTCLYPRTLTSLYPDVRVYLLVSSNPCILIFSGSWCLHLHPCILISSCSGVLGCNLASSHPLIPRLMCSVCLLVSSHPLHLHIIRFRYSRCFLVSSHPHILISWSSCTPGGCRYRRIFTSSYPQVPVFLLV